MKAYIDKKHKKVTLEVLQKIKHDIESENGEYICLAAASVVRNDLASSVSEHDLDVIRSRIINYASDSIGSRFIGYNGWLEDKLGRPTTYEECRRGRLAWLDRMIQEVESA